MSITQLPYLPDETCQTFGRGNSHEYEQAVENE